MAAKTFEITLKLTLKDDFYGEPKDWDWNSILDLDTKDGEFCVIKTAVEVTPTEGSKRDA